MAEADSDTEKRTVNIRMRESFLEDLDETWTEQGFNSRSEYVRAIVRDAIKHPDFNRADLKAMLAGEVEISEGRTHSSDEIRGSLDVESGADRSGE